MISKLKGIVKGHVNELTNGNQDLYEYRMAICKECPLFKMGKLGPVCNSDLYVNPENKKATTTQRDGYIRGCGCRLEAKTRLARTEGGQCPANFWDR